MCFYIGKAVMLQNLSNMNMFSVVLLIALCATVKGSSRLDPLVSTKGGLIRGLQSGDGNAVFLGVPYAVVDKKNPFGPSKPHPGFDHIFDAFESNECPQVNHGIASGTLDCLTMNIYVPSIADSQRRLPVMVWIHGGGFSKGSADSDGLSPKFLLKHDVIVVAINYRLGAYGFMCLDIPEVPGNQGFKDQVLALRWINDNIEAFGGNPKEITVFGESAGAISVNLHLFSLYEKLFQRAIIQSGPALTHIWKRTSDNSAPIKLASELGLNTTNIYEALDYVASIDALKIIKICDDLDNTFAFMGNAMVTIPCLEKEFEGVDNFITDHPRNVVSSKAKTTSVIIGYNSDEAAVMLATATDEYYRQVFSFGSNLEIGFDLHDDLKDAADTVRHFYIGDAEITKNVEEAILDFSTDFTYAYPTQLTADLLLANGASDVYRYIFSYNGGRNLLSIQMNLNITGATHADELGYLFDYDMFNGEIDPEDQLVIDRMTAIWTNFAKFGNPTPEITELLPVKWDPITTTTHPYLDINLDLTPGSRPSHDRMAFWDLFYRLYGKYQI